MDLLYTDNFDGFCLVSSDSDFTRLACRLRESGLFVYGFGERKTPEPFVEACDKFIYTEILEELEEKEIYDFIEPLLTKEEETLKYAQKYQDKSSLIEHNQELVKLITNAYEAIAGEDGWAYLSLMGTQLNKLSPAFDQRNYGYKKLGELIRAINMFEIKETPHEKAPAVKDLYIKLKS